MKNKKGFTIIELVVGIGLLSIVTVFMLVVIVDLRNTESANGIDTKALLTQAITTAAINRDIHRYSIDSDGIKDETNSETTDQTETKNITAIMSKIRFSFAAGKDKLLVIYNEDTEGKAKSIFYGESSTNVDFKRTLPEGYYFSKAEVITPENTEYKKVIVNVKNETNHDLDYTIEAYYYPSIEERENK